jgi:hypothetical protein
VEKLRNEWSVLMACYNLLSKSGDFKNFPHADFGSFFPKQGKQLTVPKSKRTLEGQTHATIH